LEVDSEEWAAELQLRALLLKNYAVHYCLIMLCIMNRQSREGLYVVREAVGCTGVEWFGGVLH
jgi:hypothetical protein